MPLYQAIVLALVQAVTEFLPISSTAHLVLVPWLLKWQHAGLTFDVALHAGTRWPCSSISGGNGWRWAVR